MIVRNLIIINIILKMINIVIVVIRESYNYKLNDSLTFFECINHCPSNYIHVSNSLLYVKSFEYLWTLNLEGTEFECKQDLNKISDYNLTCESSFNINEYIKEIISDSTSTTDLINNIIENIEIIKYVINSLNYKVFDQNGNELDLSLCSVANYSLLCNNK